MTSLISSIQDSPEFNEISPPLRFVEMTKDSIDQKKRDNINKFLKGVVALFFSKRNKVILTKGRKLFKIYDHNL